MIGQENTRHTFVNEFTVGSGYAIMKQHRDITNLHCVSRVLVL